MDDELRLEIRENVNIALGRMLILALVSSNNLVKDIPPISLVIMGALGSLFLISREFIIIIMNPQNQESSNLDFISWRNRNLKWREIFRHEIVILDEIL